MQKAKFQSFFSSETIKIVARMNLSWRAIGVAIFCLILVACTTDAEEEFDAESVCPAEGMNAYGMPNRGTFIDERDGQEYKYTTIGNQVWMAQNLNYKTSYSMKHEGEYIDCSECGLWYNLGINLPKRDIIDSVCPLGWRVPTEKDWKILLSFIGNPTITLKILLSETWNDEFQGLNKCDFSGIETGVVRYWVNAKELGYSSDTLFQVGGSVWWTQNVTGPDRMIHIEFAANKHRRDIELEETVNGYYFSLRCIKN